MTSAAVLDQLRGEAELEWFFSRGQIAFERSTFGSVLERAELFSVARQYHPEVRAIYDDAGHVIGHERGITARPTAEVREPGGYTPDAETLHKYARVSMLLKRVDRQSAQVLELLYGDRGQRWAADEKYGRLGSLFHITAKGRQLLDEARRKPGGVDISDQARMEVIVAVQAVQPQQERGQALAYCAAQAQQLAKRARLQWSELLQGVQ